MRAWGLLFFAGAAVVGFVPSPPEIVSTRISRASVFSNGLVMLVREAPVAAGEHTYKLAEIPRAFSDTFWITTTEGVEISDLSTKLVLSDETDELQAKTLIDYLTANVGGKITFRIYNAQLQKMETLTGTLADMSLQHNQISLLQEDGRIRMVPISTIQELETKGLKSTLKGSRSGGKLELTFRSSAERAGMVRIVTVERGAAFQNSYWIDSKGDQVNVRARSLLISGTLELDEADVKLIVGSPKGINGGVYDPATGAASMDEILAGSMGFASGLLQTNPDPYQVFQANMSSGVVNRQYGYQAQPGGYSGGFGGGFGGGGGFSGGGGAPAPTSSGRPAEKSGEVRTLENLYEQPFGRASLEPGERITRETANLSTTSQALHKVTFNMGGNSIQSSPVQRILKVKNTTEYPWPEGTVFMSRDNVPLFRGAMPFTAPGRTADIELGSVDDLLAMLGSEEKSRETTPYTDEQWLLVKRFMETRVQLENDRSEEVEIEIVLTGGSGKVTASEGAEVTYTGVNTTANPPFTAKWIIKIPPYTDRTLTIAYTTEQVVSRRN